MTADSAPGGGVAAAVDLGLRIVGGVVATGLGALVALYAVAYAPAYLEGFRLPVTLLIALVGNPALVWFAGAATGRKVAGALPALAWCVVWFIGARRTAEGDWLVLPDNWVGVLTSLVGPIAFAVPLFRAITAPRPAPDAARRG